MPVRLPGQRSCTLAHRGCSQSRPVRGSRGGGGAADRQVSITCSGSGKHVFAISLGVRQTRKRSHNSCQDGLTRPPTGSAQSGDTSRGLGDTHSQTPFSPTVAIKRPPPHLEVDALLAAHNADEVAGDDSPLVDQLVEAVLTIGARLTKVNLTCGGGGGTAAAAAAAAAA
jgi:hypothetical protein